MYKQQSCIRSCKEQSMTFICRVHVFNFVKIWEIIISSLNYFIQPIFFPFMLYLNILFFYLFKVQPCFYLNHEIKQKPSEEETITMIIFQMVYLLFWKGYAICKLNKKRWSLVFLAYENLPFWVSLNSKLLISWFCFPL